MSKTIRESRVDVDEIRATLTPQNVEDALEAVRDAQRALLPLKRGYSEGASPEILRALDIVEEALEEALG